LYKKYDILEGKRNFLLPSRMEPFQKQPMKILEALKTLSRNEVEKIHLIFAGNDDQYNEYANVVAKECKKNKISFCVVKFDNMAEAYKISDCVVLTSKSESFGYAALEALYLGIPTILNNIPTFKEILDYYNGNYYLYNGTISALAQIIKKIIKENNFQRVMPCKKWKQRFDPNLWIKSYLEIFNEFI
jgi:glycosyltransferase involved in cell wall biosynthesis